MVFFFKKVSFMSQDIEHNVQKSYEFIYDKLSLRRKDLDISYINLAKKSGVSLSTIKRFFTEDYKGVSLEHLLKIASVMGVYFSPSSFKEVSELRKEQARVKAEKLVSQIQATSALEAQGVDKKTLKSMKQDIVYKLLSGPSKDLWND